MFPSTILLFFCFKLSESQWKSFIVNSIIKNGALQMQGGSPMCTDNYEALHHYMLGYFTPTVEVVKYRTHT